jgi:hypothetical protein
VEGSFQKKIPLSTVTAIPGNEPRKIRDCLRMDPIVPGRRSRQKANAAAKSAGGRHLGPECFAFGVMGPREG